MTEQELQQSVHAILREPEQRLPLPAESDEWPAEVGLYMEQVDKMRQLFSAISRLSTDADVTALAKQGHSLADVLHNDMDVAS